MADEAGKFESEMNRGFLQVLVLVLLEKSMYGYMMLKHFEKLGYAVEENTLYPRPKKFYVISKKGKDVRKDLLKIWREQNEILNHLLEANKNV
jgi:DNA-binding PadR family transcriptional regulator